MGNIIYYIYNFFKKKPIYYWLTILILVSGSGWFATKLQFVEDITQIIPKSESADKIKMVFNSSGITDRMIIHLSAKDTTVDNSDRLIALSDSIVKKVKQDIPEEYVKELIYQIKDDLIADMYRKVYNNIPLFINESDYSRIDSMINRESVNGIIEGSYKNLMSPASFALKQYIVEDPLIITTTALRQFKKLSVDDNFTIKRGYILTKDYNHLLIFIQPRYPASETSKNGVMVKELEKICAEANITDNTINTTFYGAAAVATCNADRIKSDIILTVSIAMLFLLLFISMFFKRKAAFFIIFMPVVLGGGLSVALLFLIKTKVSAVALGIGSVLLGISVDYSLHIFSHFRQGGSVKGLYKDLTLPVLLSSITTASAFLCLYVVQSEALRDLGLFASISVVSAALFALIFIPPLLKVKKKKVAKTDNGKEKHRFAFIDKITAYPLHTKRWFVYIIIALTVLFGYMAGDIGFDDNMDKMNYQTDYLTNAENSLNEISSVSHKAIFAITTGNTRNQLLNNTEKILGNFEELKRDGVVSAYNSVSFVLQSEKEQQRRIALWKNFWTPEKVDKLKTLMISEGRKIGFKEKTFRKFYNQISRDYTVFSEEDSRFFEDTFYRGFILEGKGSYSAMNILKVRLEDKPEVYKKLEGIENVTILDKQYVTNKLVSMLKEDFDKLVTISLIIIFIILLFAYGRIELAIITIIPMILSWVWALGIMGILNIQFNIFNIIISTFIFGLGIDYSIFIMRGMLIQYKYGTKDDLPAYKLSILLSGITTIAGVGVLIFAKHPALQSIALMSIIGIGSVIIITYTIQPLLFNWLIKKGANEVENPRTLKNFLFTTHTALFFLSGSIAMIGIIPVLYILPIKKKYKKYMFHCVVSVMSRSIVYSYFYIPKKVNKNKERFNKPAIITCNHQSHIDLVLILLLHPKIIVLTKDWVWNNVFLGPIVRYADFYSVDEGYEQGFDRIKAKVEQGYSVLVFPEGTRSKSGQIRRFHNGAFLLADKLGIDILPIMLHGADEIMRKRQKNLQIVKRVTTKIYERIDPKTLGDTYREQAKKLVKFYRDEYREMCMSDDMTRFYRGSLINKYIYKGPILEWYMKIKMSLEKNYKFFNAVIPYDAKITDIGCGYGFLSHMLARVSPDRTVLGLDYDKDKIAVASNIYPGSKNVSFGYADVNEYELPESDVFTLLDMLHYMPEEMQVKVIEKCMNKITDKGVIIIRDANKDLGKKHVGTKLTEIYSTTSGFNKANYKDLTFVSSDVIKNTAKKNNFDIEIVDNTKFTSNVIYMLRKNGNG
ncbi:MAG: 1-acyl-sn-glycerol-3-phosphate acyltransferase [Bacteroidales bacterium]|jgi:1-acyl-sn-glycerol-3-phosphate acyltransferase|nr:1-acyl-sn-glycerol-3-phosphate acyltransferase [Bacteroidales bacterium]